MPVPATTGQLRDNIKDMKIGDFIYGSYTSSTSYYIGDTQGTTEIPVTGKTGDITGFWYFIKVDKGLLVSDRVIWNAVTWNDLNMNRLIEGRPLTAKDGTVGTIRSLSGGVAHADEYGNPSLNSHGRGAFPVNNEWDEYIVNFPTRLIKGGNTIDDIFHWNNTVTWCQETSITNVLSDNGSNLGSSARRIGRGYSNIKGLYLNEVNQTYTTYGFRPVFAYKEV